MKKVVKGAPTKKYACHQRLLANEISANDSGQVGQPLWRIKNSHTGHSYGKFVGFEIWGTRRLKLIFAMRANANFLAQNAIV